MKIHHHDATRGLIRSLTRYGLAIDCLGTKRITPHTSLARLVNVGILRGGGAFAGKNAAE